MAINETPEFPDVICLKQFYASEQGEVVRQLIGRAMRRFWAAPPQNELVLGLGYAVPYASGQFFAGMPSTIGAMYWPHGSLNRVAMLRDNALPFADNQFNRLLLVHALEHSHASALLTECFRVLTPGGRLLVVAPNRLGVWCQFGGNPFGHGKPYSARQLRGALVKAGFTPLKHLGVLSVPPSSIRFLLRASPWVELLVQCFAPRFGGVLVMEAEKQIYAALAEPAKAQAPVMMPVLAG